MASDEARVLLKHPDPRERALALSLDSITGEDLALGVLDPSPLVWKKAFYHTNSAHALDVLASVNRDAAGNTIGERHDLLLKDPRCTSRHIDSIHRAVSGDGYLPIQEQAKRLSELKGLSKSEERKPIYMHHTPDPTEKEFKVSQEENRYPELSQAYRQGVNSNNPIRPQDADLHAEGNGSPKVIYHLPKEQGGYKFLVKPYLEGENSRSGWNESTSQELYHAAELGHIHQKSFVSSYTIPSGPYGRTSIPATVIHMEKAKPLHKATAADMVSNPNVKEDARKVAVMDFLTGNWDRHSNNLMVKPDGQLLAIDHGYSFDYVPNRKNGEQDHTPTRHNDTHLGRYTERATSLLTPHASPDLDMNARMSPPKSAPDWHQTIKNWWPKVSPDIKRAFLKRLELVGDATVRGNLQKGFEARHKWLDEQAQAQPEQFLENLTKTVDNEGMFQPVVEEEPQDASRYASVHNELKASPPAHLQPSIDKFETYVNHPSKTVKPDKGSLQGVEAKVRVSHAGQKYLLKAAHTTYSKLAGWGELASQAMYHAGGIGHLHQDVHATHLNIKEGDNNRQQAVVAIHYKPGQWNTLNELGYSVKKKLLVKHDADLKKIHLMDFLTGNTDRTINNILVGPNGQPQAIDQAFAFSRDNWHKPEDQDSEDVGQFHGVNMKERPFRYKYFFGNPESALQQHGIYADNDTHQWWLQNKQPMLQALQKHLDMIPDKDERARRKAMVDYRVAAIDNKHPELFGDQDLFRSEEDLAKGAMARLHPFNPTQYGVSGIYTPPMESWVDKENPKGRSRLGYMGMDPNAKARSLQRLHAKTEVRRNPSTNEREFLLHRGFSDEQRNTLKTSGKFTSAIPKDAKQSTTPYSSWTPIADWPTHEYYDHMVSAWIPESKISFYVPQYNMPELPKRTKQNVETEKEAIVEPGQFDIFHQDQGHKWLGGLQQKLKQLHKSEELEKVVLAGKERVPTNTQFDAKYPDLHKQLIDNNPTHIQGGIARFEITVNHPSLGATIAPKQLSGIEPKALVEKNGKKYLIKAAHVDSEHSDAMPFGAWKEMASQAIYHAGGIGHLHQDVHATNTRFKGTKVELKRVQIEPGRNPYKRVETPYEETVPSIAIHFKPGKWDSVAHISDDADSGYNDFWKTPDPSSSFYGRRDWHNSKTHDYAHEYRKISLMDDLLNNTDRHGNNLMVNTDTGMPQVIDNGLALIPVSGIGSEKKITQIMGYTPDRATYQWWHVHKQNMADTFHKYADMIPDEQEKIALKKRFASAYSVIDKRANLLTKSLDNAEFLHDQHTAFESQAGLRANISGVHEQLMKAHPAGINPGVRHFEIAINGHQNMIKPTKVQSDLVGLQPKALYHSGGRGYLVKAVHENSTALGAWNEMTSQAMYHAGNIGHLHQKVHATVGKTGLNRNEPAHAIAIHIEPDSLTFNDAGGWTDSKGKTFPAQDVRRAELAVNTPEHSQSLKKIGVMDYLTANHDRHGHNIIVKPDGSVVAIDHARAFWNDRKHAYGEEVQGEMYGHIADVGRNESEFERNPAYQNTLANNWDDVMDGSLAASLGQHPDQETHDWWNDNKEAILNKFREHVAMLPEPEARQKMVRSFMVRFNRLGELAKSRRQPDENGVPSGYDRTQQSEVRPMGGTGR